MSENSLDGGGTGAAWLYRCALGGGALAYSAGMLAEAALRWPLDPRTTLLSELAARSQPHRRVFQIGDLLSGGLFLVAAAARCRQTPIQATVPRRGRRRLQLWVALFGAATIADACSPLDYPISQDAGGTGPRMKTHVPSLSHTTHFVTTTVAGLAAAGISLEHYLLQHEPGYSPGTRVERILRRSAGPLVVLLMLSGVLSLLFPKLVPGLVQRAQTLIFSVLCLDLAAEDLLSSRPERRI